MKFIFAFIFIISGIAIAFGQNERSPIVEKDIGYKDWTYKNLKGGGETNLRQFAQGKRLVMVVYWAPWCPNWKHDVGLVQQLHEKYSKNGLAVIGVGEYDSVDNMKRNYEQNKLTFPSVYESSALSERLGTVHYSQRTAAGDTRKWGSPWYVFLEPAGLQPSGEVLAGKVSLVNGELIRDNVEGFIRQKLGISAGGLADLGKPKEIEVCEPESQKSELVKP